MKSSDEIILRDARWKPDISGSYINLHSLYSNSDYSALLKMKNKIGIIREGISKKGERRVAITPEYAKHIIRWGYKLIVQPAVNPRTGEVKRAFPDAAYKKSGAEIKEDIAKADVIFGLKEIHVSRIIHGKVYFFFSHTHKGQLKNREMLRKLVETKCTLIDYELIRDWQGHRLINAFTYNAGYAGMVDTLWTLGIRLKLTGISNPFEIIPQSIEIGNLEKIKKIVRKAGEVIKANGTPSSLPPVITAFLGKGKTSLGAQSIYDLLPVEEIFISQIEDIFKHASRKKVYKALFRIIDMYRPVSDGRVNLNDYAKLTPKEKEQFYLNHPELFESNVDKYLPYITVLMNCIVWSPEYPRTVTKSLLKEIYTLHKTLKAIGDITCDPNGSIEFSKETWIDNPVYIYDPLSEEMKDGFKGKGIAVMAVTNLPCEFSEDASTHFSHDLFPFLKSILNADYRGTLQDSHLPPDIMRGVILWKGDFTDEFEYMQKYL